MSSSCVCGLVIWCVIINLWRHIIIIHDEGTAPRSLDHVCFGDQRDVCEMNESVCGVYLCG